MSEFWIDFEGYTKVIANTAREAQEKFYDEIARDRPDLCLEIVGVEQDTEGEG